MIEIQNADGTPHLTYFDRRRQLSFTYDGRFGWINVSSGGYGESPFAMIPFVMGRSDSIPNGMAAFKETCDSFIRTFEQYEEIPL